MSANTFGTYKGLFNVAIGDAVVMANDVDTHAHNAFASMVVVNVTAENVTLARPHVRVDATTKTPFVTMEQFDVPCERFVEGFRFHHTGRGKADNRKF